MAKTDETLTHLRSEIDHIDDQLLKLLKQRLAIVKHVAKAKKNNSTRYYPAREAQIMRHLTSQTHSQEMAVSVVQVWRAIMSLSLVQQGAFRLGIIEADHHGQSIHTIQEHFGTLAQCHLFESAQALFEALEGGAISLALIPLFRESGDFSLWSRALEAFHSCPANLVVKLPCYKADSALAENTVLFGFAKAPAVPSGDDNALMHLGIHEHLPPQDIEVVLQSAGLSYEKIYPFDYQEKKPAHLLVELNGFMSEDIWQTYSRALQADAHIKDYFLFGSYPRPLALEFSSKNRID